jgi:uncharacterized protein (TIGR02678 family)
MPVERSPQAAGDPQAPSERRIAARHLIQHPLTCKEHDPDRFRLIRRHEADLDRWFTQRLGYRLHVDADSARLFKTTAVPEHRPLRTATGRAFGQLEYVMLALVLGSTAAGPAVISLRDLVDQVRVAAAEAEMPLSDRPPERRALVQALQWMIGQGLASELHAHVDAYATDENADAVLRMRPDRIALVPLPNLIGATTPQELLARADRRDLGRRWMRARLVEEPVLYRRDLHDDEWGELRRRLGDEERIFDEMFGLVLESRAEGVAAVDPTNTLAERPFPATGTVGHAALLLLDGLRPDIETRVDARGADATGVEVARGDVDAQVAALAERHAKGWANDLVEHPARLARQVVELLVDLRLAEHVRETDQTDQSHDPDQTGDPDRTDDADPTRDPDETRDQIGEAWIRILPAAGRFLAVVSEPSPSADQEQTALW